MKNIWLGGNHRHASYNYIPVVFIRKSHSRIIYYETIAVIWGRPNAAALNGLRKTELNVVHVKDQYYIIQAVKVILLFFCGK